MDYETQSDEQLAMFIKQGDELALDFLIQKYKSIVVKISRSYFLVGGEQEDIIQEAMIGLYKACLSYSDDHGASFSTFARKCIERNIQTAVKSANRKKNQMLNNSLNLTAQGNVVYGDEADEDLTLVIPSNELLPEEQLIEEEKIQEIKKQIKDKLSDFELKVFKHYLKGLTYLEIAQKLNEQPKSIDNALTRIKKKLEYLKK